MPKGDNVTFVRIFLYKGASLDLNLHLLLIKKPFSPCRPPLAAPFLSSPRATARICDRSISNPFSRHSGARVNNPPLMRIVHLLRHVPGASGRKRFLTAVRFHISDSGKILLCAPPELGEGGRAANVFFFTIRVRTLWGTASSPLLYILSQYCDPPPCPSPCLQSIAH